LAALKRDGCLYPASCNQHGNSPSICICGEFRKELEEQIDAQIIMTESDDQSSKMFGPGHLQSAGTLSWLDFVALLKKKPLK
jgi:hypothetical protein